MGYGGLSCYDNQYYQTPEIDRLASEGLHLTDYHSNGSVCSPTRAALMTGRYQFRSDCHVVINADPKTADHERGLAQKERTIAEALRTKGYATSICGRWYLGYQPQFNPMHQGFDDFKGFISGNIDAHSHYDRMQNFDWWQGNKLKDEAGYHTDLITEPRSILSSGTRISPCSFTCHTVRHTYHTRHAARRFSVVPAKERYHSGERASRNTARTRATRDG